MRMSGQVDHGRGTRRSEDQRRDPRAVGVLVVGNLLGGVGVASGLAVGGLLAEQVGGTAVAGLGQAMSVLGAAVAAIPLAGVAARRGRRWALSLGYLLATAGAALVILAAVVQLLPLLLLGLGLFGVSSATNLQSRYAAADHAPAATRARTMSVVIWATTVGAVAGPNLTAPGNDVGLGLGLPALAGPYLFSVVAFALGATVLAVLFPGGRPTASPTSAGTPSATARADAHDAPVDAGAPATPPSAPAAAVGPLAALRWALGDAPARSAVVTIACAHAVMVMVMVMTPVHMNHRGDTLQLVGLVISLHVLGMYALSPVFGALADRWGPRAVARAGIGVLLLAAALGFTAAQAFGSTLTAIALVVLGLGWSTCVIAGSAQLTAAAPDDVRVPLQGVTDAGMNYAGALAAALAGPVLALGGFQLVNTVAALLLLPALACTLLDRSSAVEARARAGAEVG